jgi:hypothetical protein
MAEQQRWEDGVVHLDTTLGEALEIARHNGGAVMVGEIGRVSGILTVSDAASILKDVIEGNGGQKKLDNIAEGVISGGVPTLSSDEFAEITEEPQ